MITGSQRWFCFPFISHATAVSCILCHLHNFPFGRPSWGKGGFLESWVCIFLTVGNEELNRGDALWLSCIRAVECHVFGLAVSQSFRKVPAVGSTAPHRRAAVVYLPPPPWTAANKWRRTDSRGSIRTLTLGFADGGHCLAPHLFCPHTTFALFLGWMFHLSRYCATSFHPY